MLKLGITEKKRTGRNGIQLWGAFFDFCLLRPGTLRVPGHFFETVFVKPRWRSESGA